MATVAIPMDNPCCSCKLTRVRSRCRAVAALRFGRQAKLVTNAPRLNVVAGRSSLATGAESSQHALRQPARVSASLSTRQIWTALHYDDTNHLGLCLIRSRLHRRRSRTLCGRSSRSSSADSRSGTWSASASRIKNPPPLSLRSLSSSLLPSLLPLLRPAVLSPCSLVERECAPHQKIRRQVVRQQRDDM